MRSGVVITVETRKEGTNVRKPRRVHVGRQGGRLTPWRERRGGTKVSKRPIARLVSWHFGSADALVECVADWREGGGEKGELVGVGVLNNEFSGLIFGSWLTALFNQLCAEAGIRRRDEQMVGRKVPIAYVAPPRAC